MGYLRQNEFTIFVYLNSLFLYTPIFSGLISPAELNYTLVVLFIFWNLLFIRLNFQIRSDFITFTILFIVYIFFGTLTSYSGVSISSAFEKLIFLLASGFLFLFCIYPKVTRIYIEDSLKSLFFSGIVVMVIAFFTKSNPAYTSNVYIDGTTYFLFNGYSGVNINIALGMFIIGIISYALLRKSVLIWMIALSMIMIYFSILLISPSRSLVYFVGIISILLFSYSSKKLVIICFISCIFLAWIMFLGEDNNWEQYIIHKTINESRLAFFNDLINFTKSSYHFGQGFGIIQEWNDTYPYTSLDINSMFFLFLEVGFLGVILYLFLAIWMIHKCLKVLKVIKKIKELYWLLFLLSIGLSLLLAPNIGVLGQTSVLEYYIVFFITIFFLKIDQIFLMSVEGNKKTYSILKS